MVFIKKLTFSGLYSFPEEASLEFSKHNVIVGPNNSGKSNIFRVMKLFVDSFFGRKRLLDTDISYHGSDPTLEVHLSLSEGEVRKIVNFFSFYAEPQNNYARYHHFDNYDFLLKLFDEINVKLKWKREVEGYGSQPYVEIEFKKIALKLSNPVYSNLLAYIKYPEKVNSGQITTVKLPEILSTLSEQVDPKEEIAKNFEMQQNGYFELKPLRLDRNIDMPDHAKQALKDLYLFLDLALDVNREIYFAELFGGILKKAIRHSSDSKSILSSNLLDYANLFKVDLSGGVGSKENPDYDYNAKLESQALSKSMQFDDELESDGSNLASFLFSLKNSGDHIDREAFHRIREIFEKIFAAQNVSFDVILEYKRTQLHRIWGNKPEKVPGPPLVVFLDKKLNVQFSAEHVGTGLKEVLHLLALSYGIKNSVILLDEPSVNLHPPLMRSLMTHLKEQGENQFVIVTHSPELTHYELFEAKSEIFYVRRANSASTAKSLLPEIKEWFETDRNRLKHLIDSRIFFGRTVILTEGESDKNLLLGISEHLKFMEPTLDLATNDVVITAVGSKNNFDKYCKLLDSLSIPRFVLADKDARSLFENVCTLTKDGLVGNNTVVIIENGNLEDYMKEISQESYALAERDGRGSKPAVAYEFAKNVSSSDPRALQSLRSILLKVIEIAKE